MPITLNSLPISVAAVAEQALDRAVDLGALFGRASALSAAARCSMPRLRRNVACSIGPETRAPMLSAASASAWKSTCAVRSTSPGDCSGSAKAWPPTACKVSPAALCDVAVVDHQRGAALVHQPPADRERQIVGAPFVDRADRRVAHRRRHELVEQRDHVVGNAERKIAVGVDLDHALVPAVELLDRLVDRQRVEELVGEDDERAVRHLVEASRATAPARRASPAPAAGARAAPG